MRMTAFSTASVPRATRPAGRSSRSREGTEIAGNKTAVCPCRALCSAGSGKGDSRDLGSAYPALEMLIKLGGYVDDRKALQTRVRKIDSATVTPAQLHASWFPEALDKLSPGTRARAAG